MPNIYGDFRIVAYENVINGEHHVAFVLGEIAASKKPILVRVHVIENASLEMLFIH